MGQVKVDDRPGLFGKAAENQSMQADTRGSNDSRACI